MYAKSTRLKNCPECGASTNGKSCRCGWIKQGLRKSNANIPACRICNAVGDHGGLCKMHYERQAEKIALARVESYRDGNNDTDINILLGKVNSKLKHGEVKHVRQENEKLPEFL